MRVTFNTTDALDNAIREEAECQVNMLPELDDDERSEMLEARAAEIGDICRRFFRWNEYVTIEIDLDQKTARVVPESGT